MRGSRRAARHLVLGAILAAALSASGCSTEEIIGGTIGATILGANAPTQEVQQIYYLGAFDPQGQVPPTIYRVRVHGQASFISFMRFASGWVPARFIDSLASDVDFSEEKSTAINVDEQASKKLAALTTGRRLMLFGPEGFREAPAGHRLVVVMGVSPDEFFTAIDQSLGTIAQLRAAQKKRDDAGKTARSSLDRDLFLALAHVKDQRKQLETLQSDLRAGSGK